VKYEFDHVHLKATDPERTANWYVTAFGFEIISDTTRVFGDRFIRCETQNGVTVNVSGPRVGESLGPSDPKVHFGLEHFGMAVGDIDSEIDRLIRLGAKSLEKTVKLESGKRIAFIEGPDHVRIELGSMHDEQLGLDHVHLRAPDIDSTVSWYLEAFGLTIVKETSNPGYGRSIRCETVDGGTIIISAARDFQMPGKGDANAHYGLEHFGVKVEDIDVEIERLTGMGATLKEGPIDVPNGPRIGFIRAPDDVRIELLQFVGN